MYYSEIRANIVAGWELNGPTGFFNYSAAPGQLGFPTSLEPLAGVPAGRRASAARHHDPSRPRVLLQPVLRRVEARTATRTGWSIPQTQQFTIGAEHLFCQSWILSLDYVHAQTKDIDRNLDLNAPAFFDRTDPGQTRQRLGRRRDAAHPPDARRLQAHPRDRQPGREQVRRPAVQPQPQLLQQRPGPALVHLVAQPQQLRADATGGDPNDVNQLDAEWANSLLNQPNRVVLSGWYTPALPAHGRRLLHVRDGPSVQHRHRRGQQRRRRRR